MVTILDYLPVADQIRMARTSRRLQEMVYDDTRWVSRLKSMGCWTSGRRGDDSKKRYGGGAKLRSEPRASSPAERQQPTNQGRQHYLTLR